MTIDYLPEDYSNDRLIYFEDVSILSVDVERNFSMYKHILRPMTTGAPLRLKMHQDF